MIPITLTLKNFMSYGDEPTTLSLEGMHVACLCGDNGNGKSALLDAMTWALWGKTRASSVRSISEDDLIRLGADEVEVRFEFELSAQRYRVVRKRKRGKTGAQWELTQWDGNGSFLPAGGGGMRETGKQIVQLLSMEFDTFLNSAYLQQGRADEFTRQTPDSRKRILAEILDLNRYDVLEAKARERYKERREAAEELEREIRLLDAEIARKPEFEEQARTAAETVLALEKRLTDQEAIAGKLRERRAGLDALAGAVAEGEVRLKGMEDDIRQREKERCDKVARLEKLQTVLAQKDAILADYASLQTAMKRREQLEPMLEEFNRRAADLRTVIGAIDLEEKEIRGDLKFAERELQDAEMRRKDLASIETRIAGLKSALVEEAVVAETLRTAQEQQAAAQQEFSELGARSKQLTAAISEVEEVLEMLAQPRAACPVCESDLSGPKRDSVIERQQQKRDGFKQELTAVQRDGRLKKQHLTSLQEQTAALGARQHEFTASRSQLKELAAQQENLASAGVDVETVRAKVDKLRDQLEKGEFAAPKRIQRQRLEKEQERLQYSKVEHEAVTQRIRNLEPTHKRYQEYQYAADNWDREADERERLEHVVAEKRSVLRKEQAKLEEQKLKLGRYDEIKRDAVAAETELSRLRNELTNVQVNERSLRNYIRQCEDAEVLRKRKREEHKKADHERGMYNALAAAFGKKGVQALIIENAIPELEDEANGLLSRMTDNAMQVTFETTRAARSTGNEIETLDIKITDDLGTRPYELFSGGEGFRVNFAIRIALSRLLARRAGAKLQTLILDEGFGTQDGKGREKLVQVIDTIKDDFEKILVITHVEELKDSFPQRIEVTKDAQGSRIHVL